MAVTCSALIWIHPQLTRGPKKKFIELQNHCQHTESVVYEIFVTQVKNMEKWWVKPLSSYTKFVIGMKDVGVWKKRLRSLTNSQVCSGFGIAPQQVKFVKRRVSELWKTIEEAEDAPQRHWKKLLYLLHQGPGCLTHNEAQGLGLSSVMLSTETKPIGAHPWTAPFVIHGNKKVFPEVGWNVLWCCLCWVKGAPDFS